MVDKVGFGWTTRTMAFIILASLFLPVLTMRKRFPKSPPRPMFDRSALHEPATVLSWAAMLLVFAGLYIPYFYIEVFSVQKGAIRAGDAYLNSYLIVFMNVGSFFGRLVCSWTLRVEEKVSC